MSWGALGSICLILITVSLGGCAPEKRYRILSFFFDGVPRPGEVRAEEATSSAATAGAPAEVTVVQFYTHGPFASKNCIACHQGGLGGPSMYIPGRKASSNKVSFGTKIRVPVTELCRGCHVRFRPAELGQRFRFVHGPVAAGACVRCHSPHQSRNPFMVLEQPVRKLCVHCHQPESLYAAEYHAQAKEEIDCTVCHDPHGGDRPYFLLQPPPNGAPPAPPAVGKVAAAAGGAGGGGG